MKEKILLKIVQAWNINEKPEYRGFRCANCQRYLHKAWHHWLSTKEYLTPVHFCKKCEVALNASRLKKIGTKKQVIKNQFELDVSGRIRKKIKNILSGWDTKAKPRYKQFTCDNCGKAIYKSYHSWFLINKKLVEVHFCKKCGDKFNLDNLK